MRRVLRVISGLLVVASAGCEIDGVPSPGVSPVEPTLPTTPDLPLSSPLRGVEVTIVTTGDRPDVDGYGLLIDEWDYDVGDGITVPVPTSGTVTLLLSAGTHVMSVVGVADNCTGQDLDDRPITVVANGDITQVRFDLLCNDW